MHPAPEPAVDVLGEPYLAETIPLPPDDEGEVVATLVRRRSHLPVGKAVLYVHGYDDYFFHTELAEWWAARGYHVYAVDLRKYGRSRRPHQTPCFVTDLREHDAELDAAWERITVRDGHWQVVVVAHSTGGLIAPLWLHRRQPAHLAGVVLNTPWLEHRGHAVRRALETAAVDVLARRWGHRPIRPGGDDSLYTRSLHREWSFNTDWKPLRRNPVRAAWFRAVRRAQTVLHRGLDLRVPVLVLTSERSTVPTLGHDESHCTDAVLDVQAIRRWVSALGNHVTSIVIPGARHDVYLSQQTARNHAYVETDRWRTAHLA